MRALLFLALLAVPAAAYDDYDKPVPIRRDLVSLTLGDSLEEVQLIYPPATDWPVVQDGKTKMKRYKVERDMAKRFPRGVQTMWIGFRRGRLLEVQLIYDAAATKRETCEDLAGDYSLNYGDPTRSGSRIWWSDGDTILRVLPAGVPVLRDEGTATEWRTSIQLLDKSVYD